jgi:hypothetical protein
LALGPAGVATGKDFQIRKRLAGHAVGAGPTSNRTLGPVTRRGDVQLPDVDDAARERGAIDWLGQCNRPSWRRAL